MHVVHTVPTDIEWFKENGESARPSTVGEEREAIEFDLAASADLVAAVGPLLYRETVDLIRPAPRKPTVHQLLLGLGPCPASVGLPETAQCLIIGRTEDFELKGLDIAARAFGMLLPIPGLPEPLLIVRGAPAADAVR